MNRLKRIAALFCFLLMLASCSDVPQSEGGLKPDVPAETGGVGRDPLSVAAVELVENGGAVGQAEEQEYVPEPDPAEMEEAPVSGSSGNQEEQTEKDKSALGNWLSLFNRDKDKDGQENKEDKEEKQSSGSSSGNTDQSGGEPLEHGNAPDGWGPKTDVPEGSLSPFGSIGWWVENGIYKYDIPKQNAYGETTIDEMYSFPTTRFDDANKPPDVDNWFFGQTFYDESTGEVTYGWDRWESTKAAFRKYGAIYRGDETRKVIYLTFDCGYEYGSTEPILNALRDKGAPGTFFLTGPFVRGESNLFDKEYMHNLIRRMLDEGHLVGSHTNNHLDMTTLSVERAVDEMRQVEKYYKEEFPDAPDMLYFRPPAGAVNEWLLRLEAKLGYRTVLWSYTYKDYIVDEQWPYEDALNTLKEHLHPGCVYLLHAESSTNAAILPEFIDWVRAQGYVIEPLCGIGA
jgi:peptidoglycan-N-acetylmuramic acid deacetylase